MVYNNFFYPKVKYKKPKIQTALVFIQAKGWVLDKTTSRFFVITPPGETKSEEEGGVRFYMPRHEDVVSYDESAYQMVETFAQIYDYSIQDLFDLFQLNLDQIEKQVLDYEKNLEVRKGILKYAKIANLRTGNVDKTQDQTYLSVKAS